MSKNFQQEFGSKSVFKYRARNTPQYFSHEADGYQVFRHTAIVAFLSNIKSAQCKKLKILDVGCGTGVLTFMLSKKLESNDVIGCDFIDEVISTAREKYESIRFEISTLPHLEMNIPKRDLVVLSEVLYYLDDEGIDVALNRINDNLRDGGYVFISSKIGGIYGTKNKIISILNKHNFNIHKKEYLYMSVYHSFFKYLRRINAFNELLHVQEDNLSKEQENILKKYRFFIKFKFLIKVASFCVSPLLKNKFLPLLFNKLSKRSKPTNIFILAAKSSI